MKAAHTLSAEAESRIAKAVANAEQCTSAELKVIVSRYCWIDVREKARVLFYKHQLYKTKDRNAVLIFVVLVNREFLVYGDEGIHEKVAEDFWLLVRDAMQEKFQAGNLVDGICTGVERVSEQLAEYFPRGEDDQNEVTDEVVYEQ